MASGLAHNFGFCLLAHARALPNKRSKNPGLEPGLLTWPMV